MFNFLDEKVDVLIKYSRYYLGLSFAMFLLIGGAGFESLGQRLVLSLFILLAYLLFYNFAGSLMKMHKKVNKHNWDKAKKTLKLMLNFFIIFFSVGIIMLLLGSVMNFELFTFLLMAMNIPLGIILGSTKAKRTYLSD